MKVHHRTTLVCSTHTPTHMRIRLGKMSQSLSFHKKKSPTHYKTTLHLIIAKSFWFEGQCLQNTCTSVNVKHFICCVRCKSILHAIIGGALWEVILYTYQLKYSKTLKVLINLIDGGIRNCWCVSIFGLSKQKCSHLHVYRTSLHKFMPTIVPPSINRSCLVISKNWYSSAFLLFILYI